MKDVPSQTAGDDVPRNLLRQRNFAIYWWSGMISGPGTWVHNVTASVLMLTLTGSPFMVGVVNFAIFIPTLLFGLPAGALGDRFDRRWVVSVAMASASLVAWGLTVVAAIDELTPWMLVVFCFLLGTAAALNKPAMSAILPSIVRREDVARATALNVMQFQFGQVAGSGVASVILVLGTPAWAFGINAATFLAPILAMALLDLGTGAAGGVRRASAGARGSAVEGLRFIRRSPLMPVILVTVVLSNAAVEALRTLSPTLAADLARPEAAGVIIMAYSIGALVGLVTFGQMEARLPRPWIVPSAFALQAVGVTGVALAPSLPMTVAAAAPIGLGFSLSTPLLSATLQNLAPDEYRSRVMSVFSMAHLGFRPFFALLAGALAVPLGSRAALAVFAVVAAGAMVLVHRRHVGAFP